MIPLLALAAISILESIVMIWRIRTASSSHPWHAGMAAGAVTGLRLAFVWVGATAVMSDTPWHLAIVAYVLPAVVGTRIAHEAWTSQSTKKERGNVNHNPIPAPAGPPPISQTKPTQPWFRRR